MEILMGGCESLDLPSNLDDLFELGKVDISISSGGDVDLFLAHRCTEDLYISRFGAGHVSTNCWKALARRMIRDERIITYPAQEADANTFVDRIKAYVTQEKRGTDPFIVNELSGRSKR